MRATRGLCAVITMVALACGGGGHASRPAPAVTAASGGDATGAARHGAAGAEGAERGEAEPPLPPVPSTPQPAPDELVGSLQVGDPSVVLATAAALFEKGYPAAGVDLTPDAVIAALGVTGIDLAQPLRVLLLDPIERDSGLVAVVGVADAAALAQAVTAVGLRVQTRGGFAAIGRREDLVTAAGYALTTLIGEPVPTTPIAVLEIAKLVGRHAAALDEHVDEMFRRRGLLDSTAERETRSMRAMIALLRTIDRIELGTELDAERVSLSARVHPIAGSTLAGAVASLTPATFTLFEQLPLGPFALGGRVDLMPLLGAAGSTLEELVQPDGDEDPAVAGAFAQWMALATGENAVVLGLPETGAELSAMWDIREPSQLGDVWDRVAPMLATVAAPLVPRIETEQTSLVHRGVKVSTSTTTARPTAPAAIIERLRIVAGAEGLRISTATPGQRLALTVGTDAVARIKDIIDLVKRRKTKPAASELTPIFADARRRAESYLVAVDGQILVRQFIAMYMSLGGMQLDKQDQPPPQEPFVLGLGATGGALSVRFTVPAGQLEAVHAITLWLPMFGL